MGVSSQVARSATPETGGPCRTAVAAQNGKCRRNQRKAGPRHFASDTPRPTTIFTRCDRGLAYAEILGVCHRARGNARPQGWPEQWASPKRAKEYDIVIVGAGGHGLATAYYLAKEHGITNVAVLEKGWLGGGNTGRNTTIIRSNYLYDKSPASTTMR